MITRAVLVAVVSMLLVFMHVSSVDAVWTPDGVAVAEPPAEASVDSAYAHRVISDGWGGFVVTWTDVRNGSKDIYAHRVNSGGEVLWKVAICAAGSNQEEPQIAGCFALAADFNGAIITWVDHRHGNPDIYAQCVNENGEVLWAVDGVPICTATGDQGAPQIAGDDPTWGEGAIVTWVDARNGNQHIYAQHVNVNGQVQWMNDGVPICTAAGNQKAPLVLPVYDGGAIIAWMTEELGGVWAQRVSFTGQVQWTVDGVAISTNWVTDFDAIKYGTGGAIVAWAEMHLDGWRLDQDIRVAKIDEFGSVSVPGGFPVCTQDSIQADPQVVTDGAGGAIVAWLDSRQGHQDIYGQRVNANMQAQWMSDGMDLVLGNDADGRSLRMVPDGYGGANVTWERIDYIGTSHIYAQRVNSSGASQWTDYGVNVGWGSEDQMIPQIIQVGPGSRIVWQDLRDGTPDIYAQRLNQDGSALWTANGVDISNPRYNQLEPEMAADGSGGAIITWEDDRNGAANLNICAQRMGVDGAREWGSEAVTISSAPGDQTNPQIVSDGSGGAIITWEALNEDYGFWDLRSQRVNASGALQWQSGGVSVGGSYEAPEHRVTSDGSGGAIIAWYNIAPYDGIYAQRVNASGQTQWGASVLVSSSGGGANEFGSPEIVSDGSGGAVIVWADDRYTNVALFAQRLNANGQTQWQEGGLCILNYPYLTSYDVTWDGSGGAIITWVRDAGGCHVGVQRVNASGTLVWGSYGVVLADCVSLSVTRITSDGSGGAVVAWAQNCGGNFDISAQRVDASGQPQWTAGGVPVCAASYDQTDPLVSTDGSGGAVITWVDGRSGGNDIYAQHVNGSGVPQWASDGVSTCTAQGNQLAPRITPDGSGGAIVTWEDGREASLSRVYAQRAWGATGAGDFVDATSGPLGDTGNGMAVAWGDYDNDGDLDLYLVNYGEANKLLRNDGGGVFVDATSGPLGDTGNGRSVAWGDYDNDGDLDLYLVNDGTANKLLQNNGGGVFVDVTSGPLGGGGNGLCGAWGDYDNDGDLDLYLANDGANKLLRNDGGSVFADATSGPLGDTGHSYDVVWGDYDNDGDLDLYVVNHGTANKLLRNDGGGVFVDATSGPLGDTGWGLGVASGDYDNDGDLDLYLVNHGQANKLFRNEGGGVFVDATSGPLGDTGYGYGAAWGDYDNDGDLDLYLANVGANKLFRNEGGGAFVDATTGPLGDLGNSTDVAWGDYDNDGDLDLYLANNGQANKLFRNDGATANSAPAAPAGLAAVFEGDRVTLSWTASADAQTPALGLSYNVRVGTTSGGNEIVAAMSAANGHRRVVQVGNAQERTSWTVKPPLGPGTYYWSVQAVDGAYAGSPFASEQMVAPPSCLVDPTSGIINFGTLEVNCERWGSFALYNVGGDTLRGTVSVSGGPFRIDGDPSYKLGYAQGKSWGVAFEPTVAGTYNGTIDTGSPYCADISCVGIAETSVAPLCGLSPASLDFGDVGVGLPKTISFSIWNGGGGLLTGDVSESCDHFSIVSGGGPFSLACNEWKKVYVQFTPTTLGTHTCTIETGGACADVPCTGTGAPLQRLYVDADATGAGTGGSWEDAYTTLQPALSVTPGDLGLEVWVAEGTYKPATRSDSFGLKNKLSILGGFAGWETSADQRDSVAHPTILSGELGNPSSFNDNCYHVVRASNVDTTAVLDGFTVTRGNANGQGNNGGGITISGNPRIIDVRFVDNQALDYGGGVRVSDLSNPTLIRVTIDGNRASKSGGGLAIATAFTNDSRVRLYQVTFRNNAATQDGGGLYCGATGRLVLDGVLFVDNTATGHGGGMVYLAPGSYAQLANLAFVGNSSGSDGGGLYLNPNTGTATVLTNVSFSGNSATYAGGGIYFDYSRPGPHLVNAILWGNSAPEGSEIMLNGMTPSVISYSIIQGCGGSGSWNSAFGTDGGNNLDADPLFVNALEDSLQLSPGSPAIDAGNGSAPGLPATDLLGNPRISGATVDMGAYEFIAPALATVIPTSLVFEEAPGYQTTCDTIYVANGGAATLTIAGISGCAMEPFAIDTTLTAHELEAGDTTEIVVCVTPTMEGSASCEVTIVSNATNSPTTVSVELQTVTGIDSDDIPALSRIVSIAPNPFNPTTRIRYDLASRVQVSLSVFDVSGRLVKRLINEVAGPGAFTREWDGTNENGEQVSTGVYFCRLIAGSFTETKKMVLLK